MLGTNERKQPIQSHVFTIGRFVPGRCSETLTRADDAEEQEVTTAMPHGRSCHGQKPEGTAPRVRLYGGLQYDYGMSMCTKLRHHHITVARPGTR